MAGQRCMGCLLRKLAADPVASCARCLPPAEDGPAGYAPGVGKFDESVYSNMDNLYPGES